MKKVWSLLLVVMLVMLTGCGKQVAGEDAIKVGVLQLMDHEALNSTYQGFVDALKDNGLEEGNNLVLDFQNPNNDKSALATMAQQLVNNENDLILAIGTASALALQQETTTIPILGTAITDYEQIGLVDSNEKPGHNISGSSDFCDMGVQMDLVEMIVPEIKNIGLLYTSSEENSIIQAEQMQKECEARGWNVMVKTISDLIMVDDTMQSFVGNIDALYIPTDNTLASSMASVEIVASEHSIPVIVGCDTMVQDGGLASVGVNYYDLGYQTGLNAVKILKEGANISEMPVYYTDSEHSAIYYNSKIAERANIQLSEAITTKGIDMSK